MCWTTEQHEIDSVPTVEHCVKT